MTNFLLKITESFGARAVDYLTGHPRPGDRIIVWVIGLSILFMVGQLIRKVIL